MEAVVNGRGFDLVRYSHIVRYCLVMLVMLSLSLFSLYGMTPFGAAFFIAISLLGLPVLITAPMFFLGEMLMSFGLYQFLSTFTTVAVMFGVQLIKDKMSLKTFKALTPVFVLLSRCGVLFLLGEGTVLLPILLSPILTFFFAFACLCGLRPIIVDKLRYKLLETELVSLSIMLVAVAAGLSLISTNYVSLFIVAAILCILVSGTLYGFSAAALVGFCFGLGVALTSYDITFASGFLFVAAISGIFFNAPKPLTATSAFMGFLMFMFYFNVTDNYDTAIYNATSAFVGSMLFLVMPKKRLLDLKEFFFTPHERAAVRYMINKHRADIGAKLFGTSSIFEAMANLLIKDDKSYIEPKIEGAVKARCCDFCPNLQRCSAENKEFSKLLDGMALSAIRSGRANVNDIPNDVLAFCTKPAALISAVSEICKRNIEQSNKLKLDIKARSIIAAQLSGVASILSNLGGSASKQLVSDMTKEKILTEELNYNGIVCVQSVIAGTDIVLVIRSECLEAERIEKVVSKIMRISYKISGVDDTVIAGFLAISLVRAPRYDMIFGVANASKNGKERSGDTHSFIKLDEGRFMIALCDGMGSGERAHVEASAAVALVENFYKAGFDNELVLNSVNNFLSIARSDFFSALDICVVDLEKAQADIIKLGAPSTYIRKKDQIAKVDGSGLPLGAVEDVTPSVFSVNLDLGDIVVMSTDGVSDSFEGDKLAAAVLNLRTLNPQTVAEGVLEHTFANNNGILKDDSTVIAAKLIER